MPDRVREVMTPNPISLDATATALDAANLMKTRDVGDVLVTRGNELYGVITDRDLVVRCIAEGEDASTQRLGELCTTHPATLSPDDSLAEAAALMKRHAVRRAPVVENGAAVGIVTLGDLARMQAPESALGQISSASPNR
jgi:CBS domain-containing protein